MFFFVTSSITFLLYSCGGVIGNIQQYDYNVSTTELKQAIAQVYKKNPEWIPPADSRYKLNGKYFDETDQEYFLFFNQPNPLVLKYSILFPDSVQNPTTISLTTGAKYGDILRLERDLPRDEKVLYKKLFEENFLKELDKTLGQHYSISNF